MRVGRAVAAVAVWLLAVVVVATCTWFAIDSAGREVGAADGDVVALAVASGPLPTVTGTPGGAPAGTAGATPSPVVATTAHDVHAPGRTGPSPSAVATPSRPASPSPPSPSTGPHPVPPSPGGPPPVPSPQDWGGAGTFSSPGGDLLVRCVGARVTGWALRPADGWRAEATPGPHGELDAVFAADAGRVVEVVAVCHDGVPVFGPPPGPGPGGPHPPTD